MGLYYTIVSGSATPISLDSDIIPTQFQGWGGQGLNGHYGHVYETAAVLCRVV